jgi:hypothetical protein
LRPVDAADAREEGAELEAKAEGEVKLIAAVSPAAVPLVASAGLGARLHGLLAADQLVVGNKFDHVRTLVCCPAAVMQHIL